MNSNKNLVKKPVRRRTIGRYDIILNVSFAESMVRFGILLLLPLLALVINKHLVIYTAPIVGYLFITAIVQFCVIKYIWQRYIKHDPAPILPEYGKDPNYPDESV